MQETKRNMVMNQSQQIRKKVGRTVFDVTLLFSSTNTENPYDKVHADTFRYPCCSIIPIPPADIDALKYGSVFFYSKKTFFRPRRLFDFNGLGIQVGLRI